MITDRTYHDVARWRALHDKGWAAMTEVERSEWLGEMKGTYTYTDLNRVETAVKNLSDQFVEMGYLAAPLSTKTDWNRWSVPTRTDMIRYLNNLEIIKGLVPGYPGTPEVPSIDKKLDYNLANDIEKIVVDMMDVAAKIPQSWNYSGDLFSGEV